jgi:hypothetical protein
MHNWKLIVVLPLVLACSNDAAESPAGEATASTVVSKSDAAILQPITEYELTMANVDKYFEAQRNLTQTAAAMSPAERAAMEAEEDNAPDRSNESLEQMAARLKAHKVFGPAIQKAGLSAEEYATLTIAIMQAGMAQAVLQMRPNDNQDSLAREMKVNPANIAFMRQHSDEIRRKGEAIAAEMKAAGLADDQ